MISRDDARVIAEEALRTHGALKGGTGVGEVLSGDELVGRRISVYSVTPIDWDNCWVAYMKREVFGLFSSLIVVISKVDGAVIFAGSANDEG